jgi:hypothetical protein
MTDRHTGRGWEWTEDQRESIKDWYQALEKKHREVRGIVEGTGKALPEFTLDAERYAMPFIEQSEELLRLDSRRKGRKWQHIPFSAVSGKIQRADRLYDEYRQYFLLRDDFQEALRKHNRGVRKHNRFEKQANRQLVEEVLNRNLAMIEELRTSRDRLEALVLSLREQLSLIVALAVDINWRHRLPEDEVAALHRWITIQYIDIAASMAPEVRLYTRDHVDSVDDPNGLLADVYLRLIENDIGWYNAKIKELPEFMIFIGPGNAATPSFAVIVNTIRDRLHKALSSQSGRLPSQLDFSLNGRDFCPRTEPKV